MATDLSVATEPTPRPSAPRPDENQQPGGSGTGEDVRKTPKKAVLLLGNPSVGKTTLFHRLCGRRTRISNYPGTSIAVGRGTLSEAGSRFYLIDAPGIDCTTLESEDEAVSHDILLDEKPDILVVVADGKNLRTSLLLASQLAEYEVPLVFSINMMDEVRQRGVRIDIDRLSQLLGAPVIATTATEGEGTGALRRALPKATTPLASVRYPTKIESAVAVMAKLLKDTDLSPRAVGLAILAGDEHVKRYVRAREGDDTVEQIEQLVQTVQSSFNRPLAAVILDARLHATDQILSEVRSVSPPLRMPFSEKIGEWARRPLTGIPIAAMVVFTMYLFVGRFGAGILVELFEDKLFGEWIVPATRRLLDGIPYPFVVDALVGRFGLVTVGLALIFGVVLPVLVTFFFAFGILEDSGYLPRLSVLLDRLFRKIGLNGKGVIPLVMGFSCITMAILTTRVLETRRERFIATLLLVMGVPCAPFLAVALVLLAGMSIWASITVFGVIALQIVAVGLIAGAILPGQPADFVLELPPIRIPRLTGLVTTTLRRTWWFAKEAFPFFLLAAFVLFLLDQIGLLTAIERTAGPVLTRVLGLPRESVQVVIMTLIRKGSGAALLKQLRDAGAFDNVQIVVSLLLLSFLVPCVNTVIVMIKERGFKRAFTILVLVSSYALAVGAVTNVICRLMGVTFS